MGSKFAILFLFVVNSERQVHEMSSAALGYHRVVQENRKLYNMVQDLKGNVKKPFCFPSLLIIKPSKLLVWLGVPSGNIRVYCRVRPTFNFETKNVVEFIGGDGSLVILDPSKPQKDGRKTFQFNRVFGPTATQGKLML